jgi:hypothetical protein
MHQNEDALDQHNFESRPENLKISVPAYLTPTIPDELRGIVTRIVSCRISNEASAPHKRLAFWQLETAV